ncbi:MAG: VWA domain-containing protein [Acidobacteriota bacterium]
MMYSRRAISRILIPGLMICSLWSLANAQKSTAQEPDTVKLNATLIQVPVVVSDRGGKFIGNLLPSDFSILEDGKRQEVALFKTLQQPFHAVLILDTSNCAADRLRAMQAVAQGFARELSAQDKMMVMSFDNEVRELTEFTSEQKEIENAIAATEPGFGKLLYEAVENALNKLKAVDGRRAVILFTDGVDMKSIDATAESNYRLAEELGAVIYVVKFDTRWWQEAEARKRKKERPEKNLPFEVDVRIPLPPEYGGPDLTPPGLPRPKIEIGTSTATPPIIYQDGVTGNRTQVNAPPPDEITQQLNKVYGEADAYLLSLTSRTAGTVFQAETFAATRSAFAAILDEIRNQYLIGYYPMNEKRDGKFHKIKVEVSRKDAKVRARPGYRSAKDTN